MAVAATPATAGNSIVMGANIRELRDRVSSVKNTRKITSAMKLVAAAKVRRAQEECLRSRPFTENLERILGGLLQRLSTDSLDIPLLDARPAKKVGLLSITGDRGLCGGYNSAAIKKTEARIAELKAQDVEVELITVGNKGIQYFGRRETPIRAKYPCTQAPTAEMATDIATEMLSSFVSMIASVPSVRTIVPLSPTGLEMEGDEIFKMTTKDGALSMTKEKIDAAEPAEFAADMLFEQEPSQLLNAILPLYLNGQLLRTMQDSVASELAARMSAMQAATD